MAHAIEVELGARTDKYKQSLDAARKMAGDSVGAIASTFDKVKSYFGSMWDSLKAVFSNIGSKTSSTFSGMSDSATSAFQKIASYLPGFTKGVQDAGDATEEAGKKTDGLLTKIGVGLVIAFTAAAAAVAAFTAKGLLIDSAFAKASIAGDIGAGTLSKFEDAAKRSGLSVAELGTSVAAFRAAMKEAAAGTGGEVFAQLGVNVKDSNDALLATGPTLIDTAKRIAAMSSEAEKYDAAAKVGFSGKVQLLEDIAHASTLASGTTDDQAAAVVRLQKVWHEILPQGKSMWEDISVSLSNKLTPALTAASLAILENKNRILDAFNQIYGGGSLFDKLTDKIKGWGDSMAGYFAGVVKSSTEASISVMSYLAKTLGLGNPTKGAPSAGYLPAAVPLVSSKPVVVVDENVKKAKEEYDAVTKAIREKIAVQNLEISTGQSLTEGQKLQLKTMGDLKDGTLKLTDAQVTERTNLLAQLVAAEKISQQNRDARAAAEAAAKKEAEQYATVSSAIAAKTAEYKAELLTGAAVTESQKMAIKIDADQANGKKALTAAHLAAAKADLVEMTVAERALAAAKTTREVDKYIAEGAIARNESTAALAAEYAAYGKSADARDVLLVAVKAEADMQREIQKLKDAHTPADEAELVRLAQERDLRTQVGQATLAQTKALQYAAQLADENKKFAAESVLDEKDRATALLKIDSDMWLERIRLAGDGTRAQQELQAQYNAWYANQLAKPQLEQQKAFIDSFEKTAHDTFVSIGDGGANMWKRLRDSGRNIFFDWLYQMTLKKWVINVSASLSESMVGSTLSAAGGGSGSGLAGLYSALSGGMTLAGGLGSGFMGSLAGGLNGAGVGSGLTSAAGLQIGTSIANVVGPTVAGAISSGLGALAAAAPWVAGAVAVFTIAKKAFGMGSKEYSGNSTLSGSIGANGLDANMLADWTKKGGWFRSDQHGTDPQAVSAELAAGLVSTYKAITDSTSQYAKVLGINADAIANRSQALNIALGKDDAANQKAITDFFSGVADTVAREVLPDLVQFQQAGETAAQTLQRLAGNFQGVNVVLAAMGTDSQTMFGAVGVASIAARERLLQFAGGLDALASQTAFYTQNILTEADRAKALLQPVADTLAALGFAGLTTTAQYKDAVDGLVKSGKVATEEGAKQFAGLMALAPQFKTVADYLAAQAQAAQEQAQAAADKALQIASARSTMEIQIMELQGDAAGALTAQRDLELAAMDESLRPLQNRIYALQDEKAAADAAAEATAENLRVNEATLRGLVDSSMSALGRAIDAQKARVQSTLQDTLAGLDTNIARVNDTIKRTGDLSKALKGAITAPAGVDSAAPTEVARAAITTALAIAKASGVLPTAESMADALAAVSRDNGDNFATLADYQRATARTNAELEALGGLTDGQLDTATLQLQVLQDQKVAAQAAADAETQRLDGILTTAQAQLDAINGVDNSVLSVVDALAAMQVALVALRAGATAANPGGVNTLSGTTTVEDLYRQVLGREGEAAGIAYWKNVFGDAVDHSEYLAFVKGALPELQGPPTVADTASSSTMSGSSAMSAEQQQINARMEASMSRTAAAVEQLAQQFNQVSAGGNALATESI